MDWFVFFVVLSLFPVCVERSLPLTERDSVCEASSLHREDFSGYGQIPGPPHPPGAFPQSVREYAASRSALLSR